MSIRQISRVVAFSASGDVAEAELSYTPVSGWPVTIFIDGVSSDDAYSVTRNSRSITADLEILNQEVKAIYWVHLASFAGDDELAGEAESADQSVTVPDDIEQPSGVEPMVVVSDFWPDWSELETSIDGYDPAVTFAPECYGQRPQCIANLVNRFNVDSVAIDAAFNGS